MSKLTTQQYNLLLRPVAEQRVGRNPKGFAHMEAWDIRRTLTRIFGFGGFDEEILSVDLVAQIEIPPQNQTGRSRWSVVYRVTMRLTVRYVDGTAMAVYENGACGDSTNQPSLGDCHDNAFKTGLSQALKRCAINLGDQFGLSLYNAESREPVIVGTLNAPPAEPDAQAEPVVELPVTDVKPEPDAAMQHSEWPAVAQPPDEPASGPEMVTEAQHKAMHPIWKELGYPGEENRDNRLLISAKLLGLASLATSKDLTKEQADVLITRLKERRTELRLKEANP